MKRLLSITLLALLIPIGMRAQGTTNYDLWIAGTQITSANASEISVLKGTVSFNPSTNTLTLNDATISGTTISNGCIVSGLSSLNIVLKGNNTLDCSQDSCTAIRSVAKAALTITKGEEECSLSFNGGRAIRDFNSVTLSGLVWDRTCAYQLATINNGSHTGMMLYDTVEDEIGEINILDAENLPHPSMYSHYDPEQTATLFGFEADPSWEIRYSIDYVDESLEDVTNALYDMQQDENGVPLQGAATVTAWTVFGNATSDVVKGKLFELSETSLYTVNGAAPLSAPTLRPAIEPEDGISVSYTGTEQSDVATIDPTTGEVTILGLGNESFSVNIVIAQENGCTVLNEESLPFEVNVLNSYPLYIGDTQVTEANADDVLGDGKVSFTVNGGQEAAPTYTLKLNGATITGPVKVGLANLTFELREANTITTNEICIQNIAQTFVPSLTFMTNPDVEGSLILTNNNGPISEIGQGNISVSKELAVLMTVNGEEDYTSNLYYITDGSTTVAKIVPSYGVQIGEKQVYAGNAANVFGDRTVSFDKTTNTLTLNGANRGAISTSLAELTIELIGPNTLSEQGSYPVLRSLYGDDVTITIQSTDGSGGLTMNMPFTQAGNFCDDNVNLEISRTLSILSGSLTGNDGNENTVEIGLDYGITIYSADASYRITSINRLDVVGDKGSVQFDGKNTLILNRAELSGVSIGAVGNWVQNGLTIYLKRGNSVFSEYEDALSFEGSGANMPLTFATGDVEPGTLTLSYSDQPLVGFTPTYLNNLISTYDDHTLRIAPGLKPVVDHSGEVANFDGDDGDGLGKDIEGIAGTVESPVAVSATVNNIHYNLGTDDGFVQDGDDKLVALNTTHDEDDIPEDAVPGTPEFNVQGVLSMLIPAGDGKITIVAKTEGDGEPVIKMGTNLIPRAVPPTEDGHMLRYTFQYAVFKATLAHIFNKVKTPATSRHRAPGKKMPNTIGIKSVSVSARRVASAPPPSMSPKALTKEMVAAVKEENHIAVSDKDVTSIAPDAFDGQTGITYVDLSSTSITGTTIDRTEFPADAIILLPAGNTTVVDTKNVVIGGVCEDLLLDDSKNFEIPSDFTAVKVAQKREYTADKNSTVCLPYALDETQASALGTFYEPTAIASGTVTMTSVTKTEANVPYMLKAKGTKVSAEMVEVKKPTGALTGTETRFVGTYSGTSLSHTDTKQYYCFTTDGTFIHVETDDVHVKPFRAYIALDSALGRSLDIDFGDGTTGIKNLKVGVEDNVYYDLQGRRVLYPKKGIYIQNGKKVIIK